MGLFEERFPFVKKKSMNRTNSSKYHKGKLNCSAVNTIRGSIQPLHYITKSTNSSDKMKDNSATINYKGYIKTHRTYISYDGFYEHCLFKLALIQMKTFKMF